ncbi:cytochrome b [Herminiimonas fonticola]|uniref:cytochrome b n=1 Tax=Herminiimonas fonticola TaxID=303380 RepID=UPI003341A14A
MRSSTNRYSLTAIALHWLMAILIIATFLLGLTMVDIPGLTPTKLKYFSWHKWLGVTIFGLACLRLLWRLTHTPPAYAAGMSVWQKKMANAAHGLLYLLIFAVPVSGYFYSLAAGVPVVYLGILPLPVFIAPDPELKVLLKQVHYACNVTLLIVFCLHVLGALKHQFIDRDRTLQRMLP